VLGTAALVSGALLLAGCGQHYLLLNPAGPVAKRELGVMLIASIAMAIVLLAAIGLFAYALWRFRDRPGRSAIYTPEWDGGVRLEVVLFAIPLIIVGIISIPVIRQTLSLQRLPQTGNPLVINVTSVDWKWLFEYPKAGIASVNTLEVPAGVPLLFELTADSPMNAFWVPQLGGMEYAMPGRVLPLWLEANQPGVYMGRSANFSGPGFAYMTFSVHAVAPTKYAAWVREVRGTAPALTLTTYRTLLHPGVVRPAAYSSFPARTFPAQTHGFSLVGGMYQNATVSG
jgi:heme/copper-type cytochrome/quinol oxidase subunit 2